MMRFEIASPSPVQPFLRAFAFNIKKKSRSNNYNMNKFIKMFLEIYFE